MPEIISIQVGRAVTYQQERPSDGKSRSWRTGFFKSLVGGSVAFSERGVEGDEQADRENHGGIDKAVLAYSAEHYAYWRPHLNLPDMPYGGFGENFTIAGLDGSGGCIGRQWLGGPNTPSVRHAP